MREGAFASSLFCHHGEEPMSYLVEYLGNEGNVSILHRVLGRLHFPPNPGYKNRRVIEVETSALRDELLDTGNPHGISPVRYAEPTDLLSAQNKKLMLDLLIELGLVTHQQAVDCLSTAPPAPPEEEFRISPAAMELAVEHELDPTAIHGTGKDGSVTKADVQAAVDKKG